MASPEEERDGRRGFLLKTALGALTFAFGGALVLAAGVAMPPARRRRLVYLGAVGDFVPGTWRLLPNAPIYVVCDERGVAALSARCTHLGCTVRRRGDGFRCPCHGSTFDAEGRALTPPATDPLAWMSVGVIARGVYADPSRLVPPGSFTSVGGAGG